MTAGLPACAGAPDAPAPTADAPVVGSVAADVLSQTWQVRMAADAARAPFEGRASWLGFMQGQRAQALAAMATESDPAGLARMHLEYAATYRQATLAAARATIEVYGADAQPSDPAEADYLVGVSGLLAGDAARAAQLDAPGSAGVPSAQPWTAWRDSARPWPPMEAMGIDRVRGEAGGLPGADLPLHLYALRGEPGTVATGDPSALLALSTFHELRAREADPAGAPVQARLLDPWRLPVEPFAAAGDAAVVPDAYLFMSPWTSAADVAFVSAVSQAKDPAGVRAAVAAAAPTSAYATIASACLSGESVSVDCILDGSAALGGAIEAAMAKVAGKEDSFHRAFADYARFGALVAGDRVAFALGDRDAGGRLRLNAIDKVAGHDTLFMISVAAWDAGNRNTVRAEEIVHDHLEQAPGLHLARAPLDALHVRLGRNAAPGMPMH